MIEPCWTVPELRKRGWTDRLIRKLLGEPDEIKRSLHFWKAPPTQLYACDRVIAAESDPAFVAYQASRAKRSAASKATAERKRVERRSPLPCGAACTIPIVRICVGVSRALDSVEAD